MSLVPMFTDMYFPEYHFRYPNIDEYHQYHGPLDQNISIAKTFHVACQNPRNEAHLQSRRSASGCLFGMLSTPAVASQMTTMQCSSTVDG